MASTELVTGGSAEVLASLRPKRLTIVVLWFVGALGLVGAVVGLVMMRNWDGAALLIPGCAWAGLFVALTRPFVEVRADGLRYRRYGRAVLLPWSAVDRVIASATAVTPQLLILRRDRRMLIPVEILAGGLLPPNRCHCLEPVIRASALFLQPEPLSERAPLPAGGRVRLEERRGLFGRAGYPVFMLLFTALAIFAPRGWRPPPYLAVVMVLNYLVVSSQVRICALEADESGLQVTSAGFRRRQSEHYRPEVVNRVLATPSRKLAFILPDDSVVEVPAFWRTFRRGLSAEAAAEQLNAVLQHAKFRAASATEQSTQG